MCAPSEKDISSIGSLVRQHFNFTYMKKSGLTGIIDGAGFMRVKEGKRAFVVNFYPNEFIPEIWAMVDIFYAKKAEKIEAENKRKIEADLKSARPKRPRIPASQPVWKRR